MSNYLYGLDLSLKSTGVAIYDLDKEKFVHVSHIDTTLMKTEKNRDLNSLKLLEIYNTLFDLKEKYPPKYVAIERPFIAQYKGALKGGLATEYMYMVHGVNRITFADIKQEYYPPTTVKAKIFHGHAKKEELQTIVLDRFPYLQEMMCTHGVEGKKLTKKLVDNSQDESDAICIALTFLIEKGMIDWVKPEKKKVKAVVPDFEIPKSTKPIRKVKKGSVSNSISKRNKQYKRGIKFYGRR